MKNIIVVLLASITLISCSKKKQEEDPNVFYTCSMDPQVMEKKPGNCPICKMELTKTVVSQKEENDNSLKLSETQIKLANIKTETISFGSVGEGLTLRATVVPDERKVDVISSRVPGRIEKLYFKNEGESIKTGDHIYDIYSEELQAAINQYLLLKEKVEKLDGGNVNYKAMLKSAKDKLIIWGLSENQVSKLTANSVSTLIPFYSKVNGVVNEVLITEGDYVNEGSGILNIANYSTVWVQAEAYPKDVKFIAPGLMAKIVIEAFPHDTIDGKISFENPELEQQSKINLVRVEIPNKDGRFKPGMRATVTLLTEKQKAVSVPEEAILYQPQMNVVWVMNEKGGFNVKMVELGIRSNGYVEVKSGLEEGDKVVVSGAYLLNSEYLLRKGTNSMENMPGM
ncbi:MAG: efflux RND transporter periplasmic adaptor subunit [Cytophagaceae bacterium]|nr:efflux RND transporter periplasmic adaptor subunit [Cytophagaceae bacterium]